MPATPIPYRRSDLLPKDAFVVHFSKLRMIGLIFLCCIMLAAAVYATTVPTIKAQLAGWGGLAFFGFGLLWMIWQMGRMEPVLVISREGVDYRRLPIGTVPWEQITDVWVGEMRGQRFLCLTLRDEEPYWPMLHFHQRMLAKGNRAMGFPLLTITFTGTTAALDDAVAAVAAFRPASAGKPPQSQRS